MSPAPRLEGQGRLWEHGPGALDEHVREGAVELGEAGVHEADALGLGLGELCFERLQVSRERAQRLHLIGGEPGLAGLPHVQGLGHETGVHSVVLYAGETPEPADGPDLQGIDDADRIAAGRQVGAAGHPVVTGGLHADDHVLRLLGHPLEPAYGTLKAGSRVLEAHWLAKLFSMFVHRRDHVVNLCDVHTRVDHPNLLR